MTDLGHIVRHVADSRDRPHFVVGLSDADMEGDRRRMVRGNIVAIWTLNMPAAVAITTGNNGFR